MVKILIFIFLFLITFEKCTRKYVNPYKLIMIFGKKGSGKTTTLTKIALDEIKKKKKVYSTIEIPGTEVFEVDEIGYKTFPPESVVLIDEVGMIWDSRDFSKFPKEVRDFFKYQRQYKIKVYLFSQTFDVDKKIRDLTDEMYLLKNVARVFSVQRRILKKITISHADSNASGVSCLVDDYRFDIPLFGGLKVVFIPRYISYFKSFDPKKLAYIDGKYLDMNDLQKEYLSTIKWLVGCLKIIITRSLAGIRSIFIHS